MMIAEENEMDYYEVSSKENDGIYELFDGVIEATYRNMFVIERDPFKASIILSKVDHMSRKS